MTVEVLAAATLGLWLLLGSEWGWGMLSLPRLRRQKLREREGWPLVSVVVPARNEAASLAEALSTLRAQDYPELEIIVIDDRSEDGTGAIAERVAGEDGRVRAVRVEELPEGWLGKNHALQLGAQAARGQWLLFTDADVMHHPHTLRRAIDHAERDRLDHLAGLPDFVAHGPLLSSFVAAFTLLFGVLTRPWKASDPRSAAAIGIGAFNLVRAAAYRACGGHEEISLRPDDDLQLGKLMKGSGYRQQAARLDGLVSVEWYPSLAAARRGLHKNAFAGLDFSLFRVLAAAALLLLTQVLPFVALPFVPPVARILYLLCIACVFAVYAIDGRLGGAGIRLAVLHPVAVSLLVLTMLEATARTLATGGIVWRGTRYPLRELRRGGRARR